MGEARQGKIVQEEGKSYLRLFVAKHKTSKTYGHATLYLSGLDIHLMEKFMIVWAKASSDEPLLTRASGTSYGSKSIKV